MSEPTTNSNSFYTIALLGIAFIILKLCGVIGWSWWWVLFPFWIPYLVLIFAFIAGFVWSVIASYKK